MQNNIIKKKHKQTKFKNADLALFIDLLLSAILCRFYHV